MFPDLSKFFSSSRSRLKWVGSAHVSGSQPLNPPKRKKERKRAAENGNREQLAKESNRGKKTRASMKPYLLNTVFI